MYKQGYHTASDIYSSWLQASAVYMKWAAKHNIHYYEMLVLYALDEKKSMTQKSIAQYYGLPKQTIHNVIKDLRERKFLIFLSNADDKREKIITLSEAGQTYAKEELADLYRIETYVCESLGKDKIKQMIETVELFNLLFEKELEK